MSRAISLQTHQFFHQLCIKTYINIETNFPSIMENQQPAPRRERPSRHKPLRTNEAWDKVVCTIEDLKLQGSLRGAQTKSVIEAVHVLKTIQTSARRKKYKRFLYNVLRESGPQAVLICAAALGQTKAADMKELDRNLLVRQIQGCEDINHSTMQSLAIRYQIPRSESDVTSVPPLPQNVIQRHRKRKGAVTKPPDLIVPTTEPRWVDGSQNPETRDLVVTSGPAPHKQQPNLSSHYQDERPLPGSQQILGPYTILHGLPTIGTGLSHSWVDTWLQTSPNHFVPEWK
ncbi:hypothetical protein I7I51_07508 [Histoplasma capsulatum]|uniref:Uncharacterized protein n=1 Tax=Ajellomyces capsulatus TaxID=5037 RepID=A0A8A1LVC2_AJECA|nr:predicted protein [Histoplasma mississippiense (nom. inval.)]EDN02520.1 predicted protein [Histoplasma mississippiense (nom. inval.)]QSS58086.1 hypothetical protein I7I51_07508 [Histoplasma capsulatum]